MTEQTSNSPLGWYKRFNRWLVQKSESESAIQRDLLHFQPAAVELEATPPNPMARAISKVVISLFVIAVIWACLGKVDVVAVARGQIVPGERVKDIQPLTLGQVSAIHVREGQKVEPGDLLVELDATITRADLIQAEDEIYSLQSQKLRAEQLQWFIESGDFSQSEQALSRYLNRLNAIYPNIDQSSRDFGGWSLMQEIRRYQTEYQTLYQQMRSRQAEARMVAANVTGAEQTLPIVAERLDALERLMEQNLVARSQYLELKQQHIEQQQALTAGQENHQQLLGEVAELEARIQSLKATRLAELASQQEQLARQISSLTQDIARASERNQQTVLRAPIGGTVKSLSIHTLGGVVQPAQVLMQIIPENSQLEVEAWVENKDIGFVETGQVAEVKVDSFQFTKYGVINGKLETLSEDAVNDEQRGPIYRTLVSLEQDWMQIDNKQVRLTPGMSVAVEVKTGQRRLIEYFLSPFLRYSSESVRER